MKYKRVVSRTRVHEAHIFISLNCTDVRNSPVSAHNDCHAVLVHISNPHNSQLNWNPNKVW